MSDKPAEWGSDPAVSSSSRIEQQGYGEIDKLRWQVETLTAEIGIALRAWEATRQERDRAEAALREAEATREQLRAALVNLRDYFAYGQRDPNDRNMMAGATPRCTPSVWKEIQRQVAAALADPPPGGTEKGSADGE